MKRFKKIYVEITNSCNLSCSFCDKTSRKLELIDISKFEVILNKIQPYTDYIYLHVKGEPLLHPKIDEMLDLAHMKGFKVNITTNATLLEKLKDKLLLKPALRQINISLHSILENKLESKEIYLNKVLNVINQLSNKGILISLRLWNLNNNTLIDNEVNNFILKNLESYFSLNYKLKDELSNKMSIKLKNNIYLNLDNEFAWPSLKKENIGNSGFCYALRTHVGILVDGTVIPCCLDGDGVINLGNIFNSNFSDIINNERAIKIFDGFSNRVAVEELCMKCGYRLKMEK